MIRRTVQSGLLAAVAVLAFLPTAAGAAPAGATAPRPAPTATAQHPLPSLPPAPARHRPARHHGTHRAKHRTHRARRGVPGRVVTHHRALNVRSGPGTGFRVVGHRYGHRLVYLTCERYGSGVFGNHVWYRLPHHRGYVSARYVRVGAVVPWC